MTQQPYPTQSYDPGPQPPMRESGDERAAAVIAHLSAPIAALVSAGWLRFVGPLVVWFIYKDKSPAVRRAAGGAFNFNVSFWILYIVGWILFFTVIGLPVALLLWLVIFVVAAVCHIQGAIRSSRGESYTYPFQIPILH